MNKPKAASHIPEIALTAAMFLYGTSFIATKIALETYDPITIITVRNVISGLLLLGTLLLREGKKGLPKIKELKILLLVAVFQPFLYFLSETYGITMVEASLASIIIATIPVFTPLIARFFFDEGLNKFNYLGLLLSAAGVALIVVSSRTPEGMPVRPLGIILLFGAVFAAVGYSIVVKKTSKTLSSLAVTSMQNCMGALLFLPLFFAVDYSHAVSQEISALPVLSIVYLAIFPSSLAFLCMNAGIRAIGPTRAMVFTNMVPVVTAVLSFYILHETFTLLKVTGMVIILCGVILSQRGSAKTANEIVIDR